MVLRGAVEQDSAGDSVRGGVQSKANAERAVSGPRRSSGKDGKARGGRSGLGRESLKGQALRGQGARGADPERPGGLGLSAGGLALSLTKMGEAVGAGLGGGKCPLI